MGLARRYVQRAAQMGPLAGPAAPMCTSGGRQRWRAPARCQFMAVGATACRRPFGTLSFELQSKVLALICNR